ncbi:MAG: tRNA (pseudouridine(54)-N(1))-methyltransferase TrmY [Archaeoglobi archaeon]|nr:tRNA (pseudouridine(54)-N(1))-methyltransferase TrmY [Candidatus Mnemosynella bozhongmuii]
MERAFVLYSRKAVTTPKFSLNDLPGAGRMDLVARCVISALWLSHRLREDTRIYCILEGPPEPPKAVVFSPEMRRVYPNERGVASWIRIALKEGRNEEWVSVNPGIRVAKKSLNSVVEELRDEGFEIYVLHEKGDPISSNEFGERVAFVLGDHIGLPENTERALMRKYGARALSLGKLSYLSSACITIVHYELDKREGFM